MLEFELLLKAFVDALYTNFSGFFYFCFLLKIRDTYRHLNHQRDDLLIL